MPPVSPAQKRLMEAAAHTKGGYGGVPQSVGREFVGDESEADKAKAHGKLSERDQAAASSHVAHREDMPEGAFLEPSERKYPVKEKRDGEWRYDRELLLAAAREARMHGHEDLAKRADDIRAKEFGQAHDALAFDRSSNRTIDENGFLHVAVSNISMAAVNGYLGREIPGYEDLGLEPDKLYQLLRDPEEMAKAVDTFNGVPLLNRHIPVIPQKLPDDAIVGAMGKEAQFIAPYLRNSLTVWSSASIQGIQSRKQCHLSAGYRYKPDMTPGVYQGVRYDGVMRDLSANHVSLVEDGRAGNTVVVGDSCIPFLTKDFYNMTKVRLSPKAAMVKGVLSHALAPKMLAMDAKINFGAILSGVTAKNYATELPAIKARLKSETAGKLAQDATLDDLNLLLDKLTPDDPTVMDDDADPVMTGDDDDAERDAFLESMKGKMSPEEHAKLCAMLEKKGLVGDAEETPEEKAAREKSEKEKAPKPVDVAAMDAAIAKGVAAAQAALIARMGAVREAEKIVQPFIGALDAAPDTAESVYRLALDSLKIDHKDIKDVAALKAIVLMQPRPGATKTPRIALDASIVAEFDKRFPELANVRSI